VTAWDVLEHLPDLTNYIDAFTSLLRSGGHLFVTVPNIASLSARLAGRYWNAFLLEHLWYFSPKTLERFMFDRGFKRIAKGFVPYDVPLSHLVNRLLQIYGLTTVSLPRSLGRFVVSLPIGLMFGVFKKIVNSECNSTGLATEAR
jgi:hypothetical protein